MAESTFREIKFTDEDVINPDGFVPDAGENQRAYNPHNVRPWLIHDHGVVVCVVFASTEQDAWNEAVDCDKLDPWEVVPSDDRDRAEYMTQLVVTSAGSPNPMLEFDEKAANPDYIHTDGTKWWWKEGWEPTHLGNAGEPFDIEGLDIVKLPNPAFSFCALFNAAQSAKGVK